MIMVLFSYEKTVESFKFFPTYCITFDVIQYFLSLYLLYLFTYIGPGEAYMDIGDCSYICQYCGAHFWFDERRNDKKPQVFFSCCQGWKVKLPLIQQTPEILNSLLDYNGGPLSKFFRKNIRAFNSMFAFTSFAVTKTRNNAQVSG